nr:hypothetical protein [Tanacetum cinerariifolium]
SSKQKPASLFVLPVDDNPICEDLYLLKSEDADVVHLLKIKTQLDWLKPLLEEDKPETPEPD